MKRVNFRLPSWRLPFSNPFGLRRTQAKLFGKKQPGPKNVWKKIGRIALWGAGIFLLVLIFMFAWFAKDLPTPGKIRNLVSKSSTRLFDRNMKPLYTISGEKKRIIIDKQDIPEIVKEATIALEDKDFYQHHGLDFTGVARAVLFGGTRGGGSTITQQFIKNAVLQTSERSIIRKAREAILAIELEFLFSKEDILAMYLNEIPYGGNNYGVEAAAKSFFNKSAKDLSLAQAATLAALPQAPTTLSPYGPNTDRLVARRDLALDLMAEQGYITTEEAEKAKKVKLKVVPRREAITAPHFVLYVKDWLVQHFTEELGDAQLAEQTVEEGGLTVVTTLDLKNQKIAEQAVASSVSSGLLSRVGASNAGLVSIDPKRGEVMAMVGSIDYFNEQFGAYNIATAERQPGSSFKPIIYATAFKEKYNPATTLFDLRTDFGGNYVPNNFDFRFRGPITIRQALGNSLNIPAVKALGLVGVDKALKTAHDMGITTLNDKDRYGLSLALGGGEVKLIDLTTAYGVFANNGVLVPTTPVLKITDTDQKVLYDHEEPKDGRLVIDPQIAYQISSILSDVEAKRAVFTFSLPNLTLSDRPVASKTGTTNNIKDAWTMGYTPQVATGVWVGNNDFTAMTAGGSTVAAPIWDYYMERVHDDLDVERFSRPEGIEELVVDKLSNKLPVEGSNRIKDIFASWQVPTEKDDVHLRVRVCKENGLLADSSIPDELAEERTFAYVRSEMPDNPNWENPVRAWAIKNGFNKRPPTEECNLSDSTRPNISITAPSNNATVAGVFTISASASSPSGVKQVEFYIDDTRIATDKTSPYRTTYNAGNLSNGNHRVAAVVTSKKGSIATSEITIKVAKDDDPPGNITDYDGLQGPGKGNVTLTWSDPSDSDLDLIRIYVYIDNSNTLVQTVEIDKGVEFATISSLISNVAYRFVAKSVDFSGNESSGDIVIVTAP